MQLQRDEEAVSAAIATVLLFGGVISIISLMMVTMIPVIEELEGSVERHDMSAQMMQFNQQTTTLAQQGMPGDVVTQEFIPVDGALSWDMMRSGMWYTSTWEEDHSFRIRDVWILMTCSRYGILNQPLQPHAFLIYDSVQIAHITTLLQHGQTVSS